MRNRPAHLMPTGPSATTPRRSSVWRHRPQPRSTNSPSSSPSRTSPRRAAPRLPDLHVAGLRRAALRLRQRPPGRSRLAHPLVWDSPPPTRPRAVPERSVASGCPTRPMRRHHYLYGRNRYLTDPMILAALADAAPRARRRPGPRARPARPERSRLVDPPRSDPDAPRRRQGHHSPVPSPSPATHASTRPPARSAPPRRTRRRPPLRRRRRDRLGHQVVLVAARSDDVHGRIILDVEWVPKPGGEARPRWTASPASHPTCRRARRHLRHRPPRRPPPDPPARPRPAPHQPGHRRKAARRSRAQGRQRRVEKSAYVEDKTITVDGSRSRSSPLRQGRRHRHRRTHRHRRPPLHRARPRPHPPQRGQERQVPLVQRLPTPRHLRRRHRSPSGSTATPTTPHGSSTAPRTSGPSRRPTPTSTGSTRDATTPRASTATSTTPSGSAAPTASATTASTSTSSATPSWSTASPSTTTGNDHPPRSPPDATPDRAHRAASARHRDVRHARSARRTTRFARPIRSPATLSIGAARQVFCQVFCIPRPRSSGDRASVS